MWTVWPLTLESTISWNHENLPYAYPLIAINQRSHINRCKRWPSTHQYRMLLWTPRTFFERLDLRYMSTKTEVNTAATIAHQHPSIDWHPSWIWNQQYTPTLDWLTIWHQSLIWKQQFISYSPDWWHFKSYQTPLQNFYKLLIWPITVYKSLTCLIIWLQFTSYSSDWLQFTSFYNGLAQMLQKAEGHPKCWSHVTSTSLCKLLLPVFKRFPTEIIHCRLCIDVPVIISRDKLRSFVLNGF